MMLVDGEITGLSVDGGSADTYVNGSAMSADDLGDTGDQQPQGTLLEISRAPGSSGTVKYIVETDGSVKPGSHRNDDHHVGGVDAIHGSNASGEVSDDIDPYVLEDVSRIEVTSAGGNLTTELDGEAVDLSEPTSI